MNKELFIKTIKEECSFLETDGYILNQLENNIFYTKTTENEGFRISFSWIEYVDKFNIQGLSAKKRFNEIELELQKILGGELDRFYTIHTSPSVDDIPNGLEFELYRNNIAFDINTENDLKLFCGYVKTFYQKDVVTFFNKYAKLADVVKTYDKLEREKISTLILNTGTDIFYRELVIKNKSKSKDENDYVEMVIKEFESIKSNSTFGKILENFKILHSNLTLNG